MTADGVATPTVVTAEAEPVAANTRLTVVSEELRGPVSSALAEPVTVRVTGHQRSRSRGCAGGVVGGRRWQHRGG